MQYSVWNWNTQQYDVYEGPGEQPGQRPRPRQKVGDRRGAGRQLEALLSIVPPGSQLTGHSPKAVGRVALHSSSSAVGLSAYTTAEESPLVHSPWVVLGVGVGGFLLAYRLLVGLARGL